MFWKGNETSHGEGLISVQVRTP